MTRKSNHITKIMSGNKGKYLAICVADGCHWYKRGLDYWEVYKDAGSHEGKFWDGN